VRRLRVQPVPATTRHEQKEGFTQRDAAYMSNKGLLLARSNILETSRYFPRMLNA
jgi:hypothetical protein